MRTRKNNWLFLVVFLAACAGKGGRQDLSMKDDTRVRLMHAIDTVWDAGGMLLSYSMTDLAYNEKDLLISVKKITEWPAGDKDAVTDIFRYDDSGYAVAWDRIMESNSSRGVVVNQMGYLFLYKEGRLNEVVIDQDPSFGDNHLAGYRKWFYDDMAAVNKHHGTDDVSFEVVYRFGYRNNVLSRLYHIDEAGVIHVGQVETDDLGRPLHWQIYGGDFDVLYDTAGEVIQFASLVGDSIWHKWERTFDQQRSVSYLLGPSSRGEAMKWMADAGFLFSTTPLLTGLADANIRPDHHNVILNKRLIPAGKTFVCAGYDSTGYTYNKAGYPLTANTACFDGAGAPVRHYKNVFVYRR
jgi:hypothetical protein